ncbi:MAG: hypothetical protein PHS86_06560 [Syntrophaceae bacterium]|nr:hypothetical protein [Syntrophaceae bacterium]
MIRIITFLALYSYLTPEPVYALQSHGEPEGLFAHQIAHILFSVSMIFLAYWLKSNNFTRERGWRLIQISCILFFIWNLVAFCGHYVEVKLPSKLIEGTGSGWDQALLLSGSPYSLYYYFLKMDHLICVPALACLFLGLRNLYKKTLMKVAADK